MGSGVKGHRARCGKRNERPRLEGCRVRSLRKDLLKHQGGQDGESLPDSQRFDLASWRHPSRGQSLFLFFSSFSFLPGWQTLNVSNHHDTIRAGFIISISGFKVCRCQTLSKSRGNCVSQVVFRRDTAPTRLCFIKSITQSYLQNRWHSWGVNVCVCARASVHMHISSHAG